MSTTEQAWVLVPREALPDHLDRALHDIDMANPPMSKADLRRFYRAMLAAAPPRDEYEFEVWQDGESIAVSVDTDRDSALHAAKRCVAGLHPQDGPVTINEVIRIPVFEQPKAEAE